MRQVEKESWYNVLKNRYDEMVVNNVGNLILNAYRANL